MKGLVLLLLLLSALTPGFAPALAADSDAGAFALAAHLPDTIDVYIGLRTDDQAIQDVDAILAKVSAFAAEFGAPLGAVSTLGLLSQIPDAQSEDIEAVLSWLGDTVALGTIGTPDAPETTILVLSLDDRAAAEAFITAELGDDYTNTGEQGRFTVYEGDAYLLFSDDLLLAVENGTPDDIAMLIGGDYPRLSDVPAFDDTIAMMPGENYTLGMYVSEAVSGELNMGTESMNGNVALGLGVLDGATLLIDMNMPIPTMYESSAIDPAFARFVPADSNFFFQGTNLGALLEAGMDPASRAQAEQALASAGLDLDTMIEWMSGDFAVFARLDVGTLMTALMSGDPNSVMGPDNLDLGMAIEAVDPEEAAKLARAITELIGETPMEGGELTQSQERINEAEVSVFSITPANTSTSVKLALASTSDVFLTGTYNAIASVLSGEQGIDENSLAAEAASYWLPDSTVVWYVDGEMLGGSISIAVATLLGPSIQGVFDEIAASLEGEMLATAEPRPTATPAPNALSGSMDFNLLTERLTRFLRSMTISVRQDSDATLFRVTLTLGN